LVAVAVLLMLQAAPAATVQPGVITGQLKTSNGKSAEGIRVSVLAAPRGSIKPSDGQNYFATVVPTNTVVTDAQGRYRLRGLAPGRYIILASVLGYPTYYPSTEIADEATIVTVEADKPLEGVNFTVIMPPGGRVSGHVPPLSAPGSGERAILSGLFLGELLESPIDADGNFNFGHVPEGSYLVSLFPTPPGMPSKIFEVEERDIKVDLVRPALRTITGRIVVPQGPLPFTLLEFWTDVSYVAATINPDGTFRAQMQPARHQISIAGIAEGYSLGSARLGDRDVSKGLDVGSSDVSGLVITMTTPERLPRLKGRIAGVPAEKLAGARVELTGRILTTLQAPIQADGSFEFPAVTPGTYRVRVAQAPDLFPRFVVISGGDAEIQLGPAAGR